MELEHNKLPPRAMMDNGGRILDTCKPFMFKPEEVPHITVQRKAMTGRMEAFHAPRHLG